MKHMYGLAIGLCCRLYTEHNYLVLWHVHKLHNRVHKCTELHHKETSSQQKLLQHMHYGLISQCTAEPPNMRTSPFVVIHCSYDSILTWNEDTPLISGHSKLPP